MRIEGKKNLQMIISSILEFSILDFLHFLLILLKFRGSCPHELRPWPMIMNVEHLMVERWNFSDCGIDCHHKCQKFISNLCGINQKILAATLESVRSGSKSSITSSTAGAPSSQVRLVISPPTFSHGYFTTHIQPCLFHHPHSAMLISPTTFGHSYFTTLFRASLFHHPYVSN